MTWTPNPSTREELPNACAQLVRWRRDGDPDRIAFWYLRRDELLELVVRAHTLAETFPELDARLRVARK